MCQWRATAAPLKTHSPRLNSRALTAREVRACSPASARRARRRRAAAAHWTSSSAACACCRSPRPHAGAGKWTGTAGERAAARARSSRRSRAAMSGPPRRGMSWRGPTPPRLSMSVRKLLKTQPAVPAQPRGVCRRAQAERSCACTARHAPHTPWGRRRSLHSVCRKRCRPRMNRSAGRHGAANAGQDAPTPLSRGASGHLTLD